MGIRFLTLRRRSAQMLQAQRDTPRADWKRIQLRDTGRCFRARRTLATKVRLRGYPHPLRQIAVADLGRDQPTLPLTNHPDSEPTARLVDRYARRMAIEHCIRESIDFFHLDALSAEVPLQIDVDLEFTLMASTLYRLLARRIGHGHERTKARQLSDRFVRIAAKVRILEDRTEVRLGRRTRNPPLVAAGFGDGETAIPWLDNRQLRMVIGYDKHGAAPAGD